MTSFLLVEGRDDATFFKRFLETMGVSSKIKNDKEDSMENPQVEIYSADGFDKFPKSIDDFVAGNTARSSIKMGIVCDADKKESLEKFKDVVEMIQNTNNSFVDLEKGKIISPTEEQIFSNSFIQVGIFVMPGKGKKGSIEDLLLDHVKNHGAMGCIEEFMTCVENKLVVKNVSKAKLLTFFAASPEGVTSIGSAATQKMWDFKAPEFNEIKQFLENLRPHHE